MLKDFAGQFLCFAVITRPMSQLNFAETQVSITSNAAKRKICDKIIQKQWIGLSAESSYKLVRRDKVKYFQ